MGPCDYQLLLKHLLEHGVAWAPAQEIVYRDRVRYTYRDLYGRVLRLASALQALGVREGTKVGVIEWDSHRYLEMYFGIPGMGAILHTINPRLSLENVIYTVGHALENLLSLHDDVLQAAVIGVPDPRWDERPLALIVLKEEAKGRVTADSLREHLQRYVADGVLAAWAVPDALIFLDELPATSVGKIDKVALRARYAERRGKS